jgi:hypothetical protein
MEGIVGTKLVLYNFFRVLMITKYQRTIGCANICSCMHDKILEYNKFLTCIRAIRSIREARTLGKRSEESSNRSQHFGSEEKKSLRS